MAKNKRTDFHEIFDKELDDMSDLVAAFTKKNKRVHRIFDDVDDDNVPVPDQSYGLRLISVHEDDITGKENSNNVRPLSPVQIVEAPPEQILESRSPFKHPSQLTNRQNTSLRRSLFQQKSKRKDIICSTPSTRNQATSNDFFGASTSTIDSISPIRKGFSNTIITMEDLNGIELISPENKKNDENVVVQSLANIERDLRDQFQINQQTPKKSSSKSLAGDIPRRSISESKIKDSPSRHSFRSEPISCSQPATKNCSVVVEPMEISKDNVSLYRKTQLSRLSTNNLTNVNTFNMIETPCARQNKPPIVNNSILAKKLALCASDSDLTDDESDMQISSKSKTPVKKRRDEIEENLTNDESDKEVEQQKRRKSSQNIEINPKKAPSRKPSRQSEAQVQNQLESSNNNYNNVESDHEEEQFEIIVDDQQKSRQQIVATPKKSHSQRPSKNVVTASHKNNKNEQEAVKIARSSQKSKKIVQNDSSSDESEEEIEIRKNTKSHKNNHQVDVSPKKMPSRRPSTNIEKDTQKAKKNNQKATTPQKSNKNNKRVQIESSEESEDERPAEKPKTPNKNVTKTKMKVPEKEKSVHTTEPSESMVWSESESELNEKEQTLTKNSKEMSLSDNNRKGRKTTINTESMDMSDSDDPKLTIVTEDDSEEESRDATAGDSEESEDETPSKVQEAASSSEGSKTEYSYVSPKQYSFPKDTKSRKTTENKNDQQKNKPKEPQNSAVNDVPVFKKPSLFKKTFRENIDCNLSNVSAGSLVPTEIVESFRTLQKPGNNTVTSVRESMKIIKPKGTKPKKVNPNKEKIEEYLRLEKSVKHKKSKNEAGKSRKRTLYHEASFDEEPENLRETSNVVPEVDPIDYEISKELSSVRRSIDTMSNASSQPFNAEIPDENESPKKKKKNAGKKKVVDESDEEMEDVKQPKRRGRPLRNIQQVDSDEEEEKQPQIKTRGFAKNRNKDQLQTTSDNDETEAEKAPRCRGRPKKTETQKRRGKQQQVTATNESDEESEEEPQQQPTRGNKARLRKRQNNSELDDSEPRNKKSRRQAASDSSKNTDEGFQSSEDEEVYDNVWYDPMDRGCKRPGLRVRKFMTSKDGKYAIQYGVFTKSDSKAEQLLKQFKIKENKIHDPNLLPFVQPKNKLELVKNYIIENNLRKVDPVKKNENVKKKIEKVNDGASTSRQAMETESLSSYVTTRTNETQAGIINRLFDGFNRLKDDASNPITLMETAEFAVSQINRLVWHEINVGVYYSSFKEDSFDGLLKIVKGGCKKGAKTKLAVVKMTLLCGIVDIKINKTKLRIENFGFVSITRGQSYRIENVSDETAIILMNRLDDEETTTTSLNES